MGTDFGGFRVLDTTLLRDPLRKARRGDLRQVTLIEEWQVEITVSTRATSALLPASVQFRLDPRLRQQLWSATRRFRANRTHAFRIADASVSGSDVFPENISTGTEHPSAGPQQTEDNLQLPLLLVPAVPDLRQRTGAPLEVAEVMS